MYAIDRHLVIIKPKEPFLEWLKTLGEKYYGLELEDIRQDNTAFMIPAYEHSSEMCEKYIKSIFPDLFDMQLEEWVLNERLWPMDRDYELFKEWFDVELHTVVVDTVENAIDKDTFLS